MIALPGPVLALQGMGAVTAIGHSAAQTAASLIGEARKMSRRSLDDLPEPTTVVECTAVTKGLVGAARLEALLPSAVAEALEGFEARPSAHPSNDGPRALEILLLPAWVDEPGRQRLQASLARAAETSAAWGDQARLRACLTADATGVWDALDLAHQKMREHPAITDVVIAAVDSWCEPSVLSDAARRGWLFHKGHGEGFMPGEAAACVRLARAANVLALGPGRFALHRPARRRAPQAFWPSAEALDPNILSGVLEEALSAAGMDGSHISHLSSDMDGSAWRARIEAAALGRGTLAEAGPTPHLCVADRIGQVGIPAGLLGFILPVQSDQHDIERVNTVLGWGVDRSGTCAAAVLERSPT